MCVCSACNKKLTWSLNWLGLWAHSFSFTWLTAIKCTHLHTNVRAYILKLAHNMGEGKEKGRNSVQSTRCFTFGYNLLVWASQRVNGYLPLVLKMSLKWKMCCNLNAGKRHTYAYKYIVACNEFRRQKIILFICWKCFHSLSLVWFDFSNFIGRPEREWQMLANERHGRQICYCLHWICRSTLSIPSAERDSAKKFHFIYFERLAQCNRVQLSRFFSAISLFRYGNHCVMNWH